MRRKEGHMQQDITPHASAIQELNRERERLRTELESVNQRSIDIEVTLTGLDLAIEVLAGPGRSKGRTRPALRVVPKEIVGMGLLEAAIFIAKRNLDVFKFTAARRIMVEAGLLEDGNAGSAALYKAVSESDRFEKPEGLRGQYRLVEPAPESEVRAEMPAAFRPRQDQGTSGSVVTRYRPSTAVAG
jgi:hypothetical protein